MNDSFSSGQPLYLLYSATASASVTSTTVRPSASRDIATLAIGSVRFHVTGRPPTWSVRVSAPRRAGARLMLRCSALTTTTQAATATATAVRLGRSSQRRSMAASAYGVACRPRNSRDAPQERESRRQDQDADELDQAHRRQVPGDACPGPQPEQREGNQHGEGRELVALDEPRSREDEQAEAG